MQYSALVLAAGSGTRMKLGYNKVFYALNDGRTVLDHALEVFREDERCKQIVLVCSTNDVVPRNMSAAKSLSCLAARLVRNLYTMD